MSSDAGKLRALDTLTAYISAHGGEIPRDPNALVYFSRTRTDCEEVTYQDANSIVTLYQKNLKKYRQGKVFLEKYNREQKQKDAAKRKSQDKQRRTSFPPRINVSNTQKFRKREESNARPSTTRPSRKDRINRKNRATTSDTLTAPVSPYSQSQQSLSSFVPQRARSTSPTTPKSYKTRDLNVIHNYEPKDNSIKEESITNFDSEEKDDVVIVHTPTTPTSKDDESVSGDEQDGDDPLNIKLQESLMTNIVKIDLYDQTSGKEPANPEIVQPSILSDMKRQVSMKSMKKQNGKHDHDHHLTKDGKCTKCDCDHDSHSHSHSHSKRKKKRRSKSRDSRRDSRRDRDRKGIKSINSSTTSGSNNSNSNSSSSAYEHGSIQMSTSPNHAANNNTLIRKKSGSLSIEQSGTTLSHMDYDLDDIEFMEQSIMSTTQTLNTRIVHKSYETTDDHNNHRQHSHYHTPIGHSQMNTLNGGSSIDIDDKKYGDDGDDGDDNEESKDADDSFSSFVADEEKNKIDRMSMDIYEQRALKEDEFVNSQQLRCCYAGVGQDGNNNNNEEKGVWATILSLFGGDANPVQVSRVVSKSDSRNNKK